LYKFANSRAASTNSAEKIFALRLIIHDNHAKVNPQPMVFYRLSSFEPFVIQKSASKNKKAAESLFVTRIFSRLLIKNIPQDCIKSYGMR
jgi:hypothetical protein